MARSTSISRGGGIAMLQPGARHALDERVRGPGALLELQLAPLDLELVAPAVQPLELDEELARAVLANRWRRPPSPARRTTAPARRSRELLGVSRRTMRSGHPFGHAQQRAARAGIARAAPHPLGRCLRPTIRSRGRACVRHDGQAAPAPGPRCDSRCMNCLTIRSSSEWKLMTASRPPGASTSKAPASPRSSWPSSSFTNMRRAWKVRVAGCLPGSRVRTARETSAASWLVRVIGSLAARRPRSLARRGARSALLRASRSPRESRRGPRERASLKPVRRVSRPCACRAGRRRGS